MKNRSVFTATDEGMSNNIIKFNRVLSPTSAESLMKSLKDNYDEIESVGGVVVFKNGDVKVFNNEQDIRSLTYKAMVFNSFVNATLTDEE